MANAHAPATAKGRATRERILQAAAELIAEKGTAGMSLDDVRARTGASRSQLYHYFEDRDDLVHAVIDVTIDAVLDTQGELLDHLDSWAAIDRWFDSLVQHQTNRQACGGCPIGSLAGQLAESDPDARAAIAAGLERWEAHLREPFFETAIEHVWGGVWNRPGLELKYRSLVVVSVLAAIGQNEELKTHLRGALNLGWTVDELREALLQISGYAGFPAAHEALRVLSEIVTQR